jgi:hypothetical protein
MAQGSLLKVSGVPVIHFDVILFDTADDVDTLLAVYCTPMDDNGRPVVILM